MLEVDDSRRHQPMGITTEEEDEVTEDYNIENEFPDWQLIDEISIRLLEEGIGTFETLQRALPSIVLAQIQQIRPESDEEDDEEDDEKGQQIGQMGINNKTGKKYCSPSRMLKLFRLAQLELDYLLKSQQEMVEKLTKAEERAKRLKRENKALREQFIRGPTASSGKVAQTAAGEDATEKTLEEGAQWGRELFRCMECTKIFLHANFLAEHIQRRHGGNFESAARLSSMRTKAGKVLGLGGNDDELFVSGASSSTTKENSWPDRATSRTMIKRKSGGGDEPLPQRGKSHGSGTYRKRQDGARATTKATKITRQYSQIATTSSQNANKNGVEIEHKNSWPSSSIGEEIMMISPPIMGNNNNTKGRTMKKGRGGKSTQMMSGPDDGDHSRRSSPSSSKG